MDVSWDDLFDATKTLRENKSIMISAESDRMRMGKDQICLWLLYGCGDLIDLLWAQALGLVVTQIACAVDDQIRGSTAQSSGFLWWCDCWRVLFGFVDVVGRRWSFLPRSAPSWGLPAEARSAVRRLCRLASAHRYRRHRRARCARIGLLLSLSSARFSSDAVSVA
jgi:hypothetical protein